MDIATTATQWMDGFWDEDVALLRHPDIPSVHAVRETAWYALGLMLRGDDDRAWHAIETVLANQYDAPGTIFHGTFRRSPEDPPQPEEPTIWVDYDPNWRQFIGCTFALIVDDFGDRAGLKRSIDVAVESETRDVPPSYSNIAMMRAWLDAWAGRTEAGERLARAVAARIDQAGGLDEFNSPTYYGIDLFALALWHQRPPTPLFRELGARLEEGLWRDIARFYNPALENLCGPWVRSYGMDMRRYLSVLGLYTATLPDLSQPFDHSADLCFGPLVASVPTTRPDGFEPERVIDRTIGPMRATARIFDDAMWGGLSGCRYRSPQMHPATAHWREPEGAVGWLRVRSRGDIDAVATDEGLEVHAGAEGATLERSDGTKERLPQGTRRIEIAR